uniref:Uncharacterized protein n=1 Tax=Oryza punctata TaxID=4537 RepID=A0A0E0JNJ8_ORYPU
MRWRRDENDGTPLVDARTPSLSSPIHRAFVGLWSEPSFVYVVMSSPRTSSRYLARARHHDIVDAVKPCPIEGVSSEPPGTLPIRPHPYLRAHHRAMEIIRPPAET